MMMNEGILERGFAATYLHPDIDNLMTLK